MHIIFGYVAYWHIPILRILKYLKFKVFYISIDSKINETKYKIAEKLKKYSIYPLPLEQEKKIPPDLDYSLLDYGCTDKKSFKIMPDKIIEKFCELFSVEKEKKNKLRLSIQDFLSSKIDFEGRSLATWAALHDSKKILYVSFRFTCFYIPDTRQNILKIIIPLDLLNYITKNIFPKFPKIGKKNHFFREKNLEQFDKKSVALITHKGTTYGRKDHIIYEKSLYYSEENKSKLNKNNILHLDYNNYLPNEENLNWVCLKKIPISKKKILLKTLLGALKTFLLIRSWSEFLGWIFYVREYYIYLKFNKVIKKFKSLKIALVDYDILCPKTLLLALEKNKIKTIATQERFIHTFFHRSANLFIDTYFVVSEFAAEYIKKSKYYEVKNVVPVGAYRCDYLKLYKKKIPQDISGAKKKGKKIIIALGYHSPEDWFESSTSRPHTDWSSQIHFLNDIIKLSKILKNTFIVLRYKDLGWSTSKFFEKVFKEINNCENVILSDNYKEANYAYKLCANADLIIAKHTSLADECLIEKIPLLFHEYSHNCKKMMSPIFNYSSSNIMCYNFEQLQERSKSLLFDSASKLKDEIAQLNKTVYYVNKKENVKNKIIGQLERYINSVQS